MAGRPRANVVKSGMVNEASKIVDNLKSTFIDQSNIDSVRLSYAGLQAPSIGSTWR